MLFNARVLHVAILLGASLASSSVTAFTAPSSTRIVGTGTAGQFGNLPPPPSQSLSYQARFHRVAVRVSMSMSKRGDGEDEGIKRRRRKRKDGRNIKLDDEPAVSAAAAAVVDASEVTLAKETLPTEAAPSAPSPKKDEVITMQVRDVRDILSGKAEQEEYDVDDDDADEELADDEEWEYYDDEDEEEEASPPARSGDALDQLLADAKKMRGESSASASSGESGEDGGALDSASIPDGIRNAISTVVTVDFFVVLGLLAWFLAGIFIRSVTGDVTVQVAFNNIFEPVVQPALGILMIASAAGAIIKEPEEDDRGLS